MADRIGESLARVQDRSEVGEPASRRGDEVGVLRAPTGQRLSATLRRARQGLEGLSPSEILALQRTLGNRAVTRLITQSRAQPVLPAVQVVQRDATPPGAAPAPADGVPSGGDSANAAQTPASQADPNKGLIVEDSTADLQPGQLKKSDFLGQLRQPVTDAAQSALKGSPLEAAGSVAIEPWFQHYAGQSATALESSIRGNVPGTAQVTDARSYIQPVAAQVSRAVSEWVRTGVVPPGVPAGLPGIVGAVGGAVSSAVKSVTSAISNLGGMLFKRKEGGVRAAGDARVIQAQLGAGEALEGSLLGRMNAAFGHDFSAVRVHNDARATQLSVGLQARAFTVGRSVAFGEGEYRPGTPVGDALIAHELAHVVQQGGASGQEPLARAEGETAALEQDADMAAAGAVTGLWSAAKTGLATVQRNAIPALRSGLKLQRCSKKPEIDPTADKLGQRVKEGMEKINQGRAPDKGIYYWPEYKQLCDSDTTGKFKWEESYRTGYTKATQFTRLGEPFTWELKPGMSASAAIKAWLEGLTVADCASAAVAIQYDTIRAAAGDNKFDDYFGGSGKNPAKDKRLKISQYPSDLPLNKFLIDTKGDTLEDLKQGDWYYFKNHPMYKFKHPAGLWSGENAIYMGKEGEKRLWSGFGANKKTEDEMLKELLDAYNGDRDSNDLAELEKKKQANGGTLPPEYGLSTEGGKTPNNLGTDPQVIVRAGGGLMLQEGGWRLNPVSIAGLAGQ